MREVRPHTDLCQVVGERGGAEVAEDTASRARLSGERGRTRSRLHLPLLSPGELLEYEEKKRQAEEEKLPLPELVRAQVPFSSCLEAYGAPEQVDDFWSTALQAKSVAVK